MKSAFYGITFFLFTFCHFGSTAQELNLDSLMIDFDRVCDCRNLKSTSNENYISCLEEEIGNPFFHRSDFLQLSNFWTLKNEQNAYEFAKNYFELGGYFPVGVDANLLKEHIEISKIKESYFKEFFSLALLNENMRNSILQSNLKLSIALTQLKAYDQFIRSDKEENLRLMNDSNLENVAWKIQIRLDSLNRKLLGAVLDSNWITIDFYGFEANKIAWLIAQHADDDIEFQEKCLKLMLASYPRDRSSSGIYLAYLIDRLSINTAGYQFFGTQFSYQDGELMPKPIQGEERVNQRRKQVHLPPLENYLEDSKKRLEKK